MRKLFVALLLLLTSTLLAQSPCNDSLHRQLDFWIGEWDVYGKTGQKAGDSRISPILDSCVILEEWTSAGMSQGIRRLTFHNIGTDKVRQHGEISKDNMKTWLTEYDLEYRRRKKQS